MIEIMSRNLIALMSDIPVRESRFADGAFLFHRDDPVRVVHYVVEGVVHLVRYQRTGGMIILQRALPGAFLAEASLFADRYHCDAIAIGTTRTLVRDRRFVRQRLAEDTDHAEAWVAYLGLEIQAARLRAEILSLKTVAERLDAWLAVNEGGLPPKGERKTLAAEIGTSPEALYREIAKRRPTCT